MEEECGSFLGSIAPGFQPTTHRVAVPGEDGGVFNDGVLGARLRVDGRDHDVFFCGVASGNPLPKRPISSFLEYGGWKSRELMNQHLVPGTNVTMPARSILMGRSSFCRSRPRPALRGHDRKDDTWPPLHTVFATGNPPTRHLVASAGGSGLRAGLRRGSGGWVLDLYHLDRNCPALCRRSGAGVRDGRIRCRVDARRRSFAVPNRSRGTARPRTVGGEVVVATHALRPHDFHSR